MKRSTKAAPRASSPLAPLGVEGRVGRADVEHAQIALDLARQQQRQAIGVGEGDRDVQELRHQCGTHMGVEMGRPDARGHGPLDLRAHLVLGRHLVQACAQLGNPARQVAVGIEQSGCCRAGRDRPPAIMLPLAGERQVHAEIDIIAAAGPIGDLQEPGAGHHHRARGDEALARDLHEGLVGAMAHADIVSVRDDDPGILGQAERGFDHAGSSITIGAAITRFWFLK